MLLETDRTWISAEIRDGLVALAAEFKQKLLEMDQRISSMKCPAPATSQLEIPLSTTISPGSPPSSPPCTSSASSPQPTRSQRKQLPPGVSVSAHRNRFRARCREKYLGTYSTVAEANAVYQAHLANRNPAGSINAAVDQAVTLSPVTAGPTITAAELTGAVNAAADSKPLVAIGAAEPLAVIETAEIGTAGTIGTVHEIGFRTGIGTARLIGTGIGTAEGPIRTLMAPEGSSRDDCPPTPDGEKTTEIMAATAESTKATGKITKSDEAPSCNLGPKIYPITSLSRYSTAFYYRETEDGLDLRTTIDGIEVGLGFFGDREDARLQIINCLCSHRITESDLMELFDS